MRRILVTLFALILFSPVCLGQAVTIPIPAQTVRPNAVSCPSGQMVTGFDASGNLICATPPSGSVTSVTAAAGSGLTVTGCPACVINVAQTVTTKTASYPFISTDNNNWFAYNSSSPGTFTFPVSGSSGFANGWTVCISVRGTGALTLVTSSPSVFWGGPTTFNKGQSACVTADDTANWMIFTGVSPVVPNPNAFQ